MNNKTAIDAVTVIVILLAIMLVGLVFFTRAKAAEPQPAQETFSMIDERDMLYCVRYAKQALTMEDLLAAYGECISILPTRLPLVPEPGTIAAGDREQTEKPGSWADACAAEYRTFDPDDGTVVRKGSRGRVQCPCGTVPWC